MKKFHMSRIAIMLVVVELSALAQTQEPASPPQGSTTTNSSTTSTTTAPSHSIFETTINAIKGAASPRAAGLAAINNLVPFMQYAAVDSKYRTSLLSDIEQSRVDQQVGPGSNQNGSTNAVTKGSVPWLLGVAEEYGAVTQSTSGSTVTLKLNPINLIAALNSSNYEQSYLTGNSIALVDFLRHMSVGASFNTTTQSSGVTQSTSSGISNSNAFSGLGVHADIYNKRDPRNPKWNGNIHNVMNKYANAAGVDISRVEHDLLASKSGAAYKQWKGDTQQKIEDLVGHKPAANDKGFDSKVEALLNDQADKLKKIISAESPIQDQVNTAAQAILAYATARNELIDNIMKSTIVSAEFNLIEQSNQPLLNTQPSTVVTTQGAIPNLSNFKLILEAPLFPVGSSDSKSHNYAQLTGNFSTTIFNSIPMSSHSGRIRDYQLSGQVDIPSGTLPKLGQITTTFSGVFLSLLEQPLGQTVQVNGVNVNTKGNIGVFQGKLSVKAGNSGIEIPLSFTYASRTELIKESDVRGNIGVTFNLDKLFAGNTSPGNSKD